MLCPNCHQLCPDDVPFCARCGSPVAGAVEAVEANDLLTGRTINGGRYQVESLLGKGGMGTVYRAHDFRLGRVVALKVLAGELVAHATARRRMAQEAQALARIEHPNVVRMFDVFDEGPLLVMALELVTGGDLESQVQPGGMTESRVVVLMQGILAGLQAIHEAGLIHRDVKPGNVLLTAEGIPKITDLGVARDSQSLEKTRLGATLGTPEYMSPEQIQGTHIDARSDVYSAGLVMFELLAGAKPFQGNTEFDWLTAHVHQAPELHRLEGKASPAMRAVVTKALEKKPELRFESAKAMAAALVARIQVAPQVMRPAPAPVVKPAPVVEAKPPQSQVRVAPVAVPQHKVEPVPPAAQAPQAPVVDRRPQPVSPAPVPSRVDRQVETSAPPARSMSIAVGAGLGLVLLCGAGWMAMREKAPATPDVPAAAPIVRPDNVPTPSPVPPPSEPSAPVAPTFFASGAACQWTNSIKERWLSSGETLNFGLGAGHNFSRVEGRSQGAASELQIWDKSNHKHGITASGRELLTVKTWNPIGAGEWVAAFWYSDATIAVTVTRLKDEQIETKEFTLPTLPYTDVRDGHFLRLDYVATYCGQRCVVAVGTDLGLLKPNGKPFNRPKAQKYFALPVDGDVEECGGNWSVPTE